VSPAAQDAYLQGRFYWNKRTNESLQRALEFFQKAQAIDPTFALAYAGEADTYNLLPPSLGPTKAYPLAKSAAHRALQLDPALAEAHTSLAFASFFFDREFPEAEAGFKRALHYNPGYATAHHWYGIYLSSMGRFAESEAEFVRAKALDPLSSSIRTSFGNMLYMARRYDEAIGELQSSLELDPAVPSTYWNLVFVYHQKGSLAEAIAQAERAMRIAPHRMLVAELGRLAAESGRRADALKALAEVTAAGLSPNEIATLYASLGDRDRAFEFLQRAERERSTGLLAARVDPAFDSLRDDPRFERLLRRIGLSQ
jgi:tetratricopeptide (TPR) repeat protein